MKYLVKVQLSSGKEIQFEIDRPSPMEVRSHVLNTFQDEWCHYRNDIGQGYFKREEVIAIEMREI